MKNIPQINECSELQKPTVSVASFYGFLQVSNSLNNKWNDYGSYGYTRVYVI